MAVTITSVQTLAFPFVLAALGLLLWSGLQHVRQFDRLGASLAAQGVFRGRVARAVQVALPGVELLVGGAGLAGLASPGTDPLLGNRILLLAAGLYAGFAAYSAHLIAYRRGVPCGCATLDHAVNWWVVLRALWVGAACLIAGFGDSIARSAYGPADQFTQWCAAAALTVLLWNLPAAMHDPYPSSSEALANV